MDFPQSKVEKPQRDILSYHHIYIYNRVRHLVQHFDFVKHKSDFVVQVLILLNIFIFAIKIRFNLFHFVRRKISKLNEINIDPKENQKLYPNQLLGTMTTNEFHMLTTTTS